MLHRYYDNGYSDVGSVMALGNTFNFLIGGRGTGKTYSALKACRDMGRTVLFIRRTSVQLDNVSSNATNPYKANALDDKFEFNISKVAAGVYKVEEGETVKDGKGDEEFKPSRLLAYMASLSGMKNLRGMSFADVDTIIYDEFIPETHDRPIKNEADAFFNLYETVNRNRELQGQAPVQCLLLANANDLSNPLLLGFNIIDKIETMLKKGQFYSILPERGICIVLYSDSKISEMKRETALYKALRESQFSQMALNNDFSYSDTTGVISRDLHSYVPVLKIDDITIYKEKNTGIYYASYHTSGTPPTYSTKSDEALKRLNLSHSYFYFVIMANRIEYESYEIKAKLLNIFI